MTKDEALKLALEFLERPAWRHEYALANINQASTAIKEALANVATNDTLKERVDEIQKQRHEQEPVAWEQLHEHIAGPFYTHPPQRTWVGLTDEEIKAVNAQVSQIPPIDYTTTTYAKAIEAKLKQKNGYAEEKNT